jgi:hypothetical protein
MRHRRRTDIGDVHLLSGQATQLAKQDERTMVRARDPLCLYARRRVATTSEPATSCGPRAPPTDEPLRLCRQPLAPQIGRQSALSTFGAQSSCSPGDADATATELTWRVGDIPYSHRPSTSERIRRSRRRVTGCDHESAERPMRQHRSDECQAATWMVASDGDVHAGHGRPDRARCARREGRDGSPPCARYRVTSLGQDGRGVKRPRAHSAGESFHRRHARRAARESSRRAERL